LYRPRRPQSTDGWLATFTTTQGTGPPPPGLHRGRVDTRPAEDDAARALFETGADCVTAKEVGDAVCREGAVGDGVEPQGCTLMSELLPLCATPETSFSGTAVDAFGSVRSSQYTVPGSTRSVVSG
jgi:hypothetical protein